MRHNILVFLLFRVAAVWTQNLVPDPYIVNGNDVPDHIKYPFVSLQDRYGVTFCGGTLIHKKYVLTAAHCAKNAHKVVYGAMRAIELFRYEENNDVKVRFVKNRYSHPEFDERILENDIALLELQSEYDSDAVVADLTSLDSGNDELYIVGFGVTDPRTMERPRVLQHAKIERVGCPYHYTKSYTYLCDRVGIGGCSSFCGVGHDAWQRPVDACYGDSGGPVYKLRHDRETYELYGITSWGVECGLGYDYPGVYVLVGEYLDWIDNIIFTTQNQNQNDLKCEELGGDIYNEEKSEMFSQDGVINSYDFFLHNLIRFNVLDVPDGICKSGFVATL